MYNDTGLTARWSTVTENGASHLVMTWSVPAARNAATPATAPVATPAGTPATVGSHAEPVPSAA